MHIPLHAFHKMAPSSSRVRDETGTCTKADFIKLSGFGLGWGEGEHTASERTGAKGQYRDTLKPLEQDVRTGAHHGNLFGHHYGNNISRKRKTKKKCENKNKKRIVFSATARFNRAPFSP